MRPQIAAFVLALALGCGRVPLNGFGGGGETGRDGAVAPDGAQADGQANGDGGPVIQAPGLLASAASGTGSGWAVSVAAMEDSGVAVVGSFTGKLTFAEGRQLTSRGENDAFVARYRKDGTVAWVKQIGDLGYDAALNVTAVGSNEMVVTGFFLGATIVEEPTSTHPPIVLVSSGQQDQDCFVVRLASDGSTRWAKRIGGPGQETCRAAVGTPLGEVAVTGAVNAGAVFAPGEANETVAGALDGPIFTALYGSDGSLQWVKYAGGQGNGQGYDITLLGAEAGPVIAGYFGGTVVFGSGVGAPSLAQQNGGAFAARYRHDGTLVWAKQMAGPKGVIYSIDANADGTMLALGGNFEITGVFGRGEDDEVTLSEGSLAQVGFVARLRADGTTAAAEKMAGLDPSRVRWLADGGLTILSTLGGGLVFGGTSNGAPGTTLKSRGEWDVLVLRYDADGRLPDSGLRWVAQLGGSGTDFAAGLVQSRDGAIWAGGQGTGPLTLSSPGATDVQAEAAQDGAPFVVRLTDVL